MNKITEYIDSFIEFDNRQLEEICKQEENRNDIRPSIGLES